MLFYAAKQHIITKSSYAQLVTYTQPIGLGVLYFTQI
jgi:hypothetical protein